MLNIKIICIGRIKEKSLQSIIDEYLKRLSKYSKVEIIEIEDEKINGSLYNQQVKEIECRKIEEKINKIGKTTVMFLDLSGKEYTSELFAQKIDELQTYGTSTLTFVIGGSLGMTEDLLLTSKEKICFSKMTFPHQLIRLFLLEQVFRSFKILNNETYHH